MLRPASRTARPKSTSPFDSCPWATRSMKWTPRRASGHNARDCTRTSRTRSAFFGIYEVNGVLKNADRVLDVLVQSRAVGPEALPRVHLMCLVAQGQES